MELVSAYNELQTKEYLGLLFGEPGKRKTSVSFDDIYDVLGREKAANSAYGIGNVILFSSFMKSNIFYPQGKTDELNTYITSLKTKYSTGIYFHVRLNENITANERMIINVTQQDIAINILKGIIRSTTANLVRTMKYYGILNNPSKVFKYDKIVIYYRNNNNNRNSIFSTITESGVQSSSFKRDLSGFYHIFDNGSGNYFVGIGKEVAGTSFTKETSYKIQSIMTGKTIIELKAKSKDEQIPVQQSIFNLPINEFINQLFEAGKSICEEFFKLEY